MCDYPVREAAMVTVREGVWCDPCLAPLIAALNDAGLPTVASCCGHGHRPGMVALADGREMIIARSFDEARSIDRLFAVDINGEHHSGSTRHNGTRERHAVPSENGSNEPSS